MATYNLGRFILNPRGTYDGTANYNKLDFVLYNGSSYVCKADSTTNKVPTNTTYWQLMAEAGQATMTPQQQQQIIDTLVNGGVIIDPDYNTFTTAEKEKLAGLSAPNNGTLAINYGSSRLGTFTANQSGNTTVNVPRPNDGAIKLVREDDPSITIGTFTANQKEDAIIKIPVGSGGGGSTPNNGTLTIQQGGNTLGTFTADQSTNTTVNIANNALTLKRNNTTVGTYTPSATAEINISVPVNLTDLNDGATVKVKEAVVTPDTQDGDNEVLTDNGHITKLMPNTKYFTKDLTAFEIQVLEFVDDYGADLIENAKSYVAIHAQSSFDIALPTGCYLNGSAHFEADETGLMTVHGKYIKIEKYSAI